MLNTKLDSSGAFRLYDTTKIKLDDILLAKNDHYSFFWESLFYLEKKYKIKEKKLKASLHSLLLPSFFKKRSHNILRI